MSFSNPLNRSVQLAISLFPLRSSYFFSQVEDIHVAHLEDIVNYMVPYFPVLSWDSRVCFFFFSIFPFVKKLFYRLLTYRWKS